MMSIARRWVVAGLATVLFVAGARSVHSQYEDPVPLDPGPPWRGTADSPVTVTMDLRTAFGLALSIERGNPVSGPGVAALLRDLHREIDAYRPKPE